MATLLVINYRQELTSSHRHLNLDASALDILDPNRYWETERATILNRLLGNLFYIDYDKAKARPQCYVNAHNIDEEVDATPGVDRKDERPFKATMEVITKDRACRRWTEWIQFMPPEWHLQRKTTLELDWRNHMLTIVSIVLALATLLSTIYTVVRPVPRPSTPSIIVQIETDRTPIVRVLTPTPPPQLAH